MIICLLMLVSEKEKSTTLRLDGLYDTIVELEERIEDAKLRKSSIEMEAITLKAL